MIVNLENVNDNTPVFSQREYLFAVREVRIQSELVRNLVNASNLVTADE